MKFGIFDYIDRRDEPEARTFDERMALLRAAEDAGFYGYHLTEHHATPLSLAPSPSRVPRRRRARDAAHPARHAALSPAALQPAAADRGDCVCSTI